MQECIERSNARRLAQINVGEFVSRNQTQNQVRAESVLTEYERKEAIKKKLVELSRRTVQAYRQEKSG